MDVHGHIKHKEQITRTKGGKDKPWTERRQWVIQELNRFLKRRHSSIRTTDFPGPGSRTERLVAAVETARQAGRAENRRAHSKLGQCAGDDVGVMCEIREWM
ncbi:MAG TPA: hypothetical protein V6C99_04830 [Oculatellaceae cyanobacterium]